MAAVAAGRWMGQAGGARGGPLGGGRGVTPPVVRESLSGLGGRGSRQAVSSLACTDAPECPAQDRGDPSSGPGVPSLLGCSGLPSSLPGRISPTPSQGTSPPPQPNSS